MIMMKIRKALTAVFIGIITLVGFLFSNTPYSLSASATSQNIYMLRTPLDSTEVKTRQLELQKLQSVKTTMGLIEHVIELIEQGDIKRGGYHWSKFRHIVGKDLMGALYETSYDKKILEKARQEALDRLATYLYPYFLWRMEENKCNSLEQYQSFLAEDPREQEIVNNMLLEFLEDFGMEQARYDDFYMASPLADSLSRSWFFRDTDYIDTSLEELLKRKISMDDKTVTVKSVGCAQGQEPYSLAMIIYEKLEKLGQNPLDWKVKIKSYDERLINLYITQQGEYGWRVLNKDGGYFKTKDRHTLYRFFQRKPGSDFYQADVILRNWIEPIYINLKDDTQLIRLKEEQADIIICLNVMVYLNENISRHLLDVLKESLTKKYPSVLLYNPKKDEIKIMKGSAEDGLRKAASSPFIKERTLPDETKRRSVDSSL